MEFKVFLSQLKKYYPEAHCALNFKSPFQLLIATILSAQCTDEKVNQVTENLFAKFPDVFSLNKCSLAQLEKLIYSTGFYKNKSKNIKACCSELIAKYNGEVPKNLAELILLPGVGRKTANVVLGNAYGIASGVVVDTHVTRLANRFGWVKNETHAVRIEEQLNKLCDKKEWIMLSHYLIAHGRAICKARSFDCSSCFLNKACPKLGT
jgi:endonuclease-3